MKKFLPAILANLSAALAEILLMAASAWLIVRAAEKPPISALAIGITLVRTAGIFRAVLRYADRFFSHKTIFKILDDLREKIFLQVAKKFPLKTGKVFEGELLHRLTVTADLQKDFLPRVILPISTAFFVAIFLSVLLKNFVPIIMFFLNIVLAKIFKIKEADDSIYREKILDFYEGRDELKIFGVKPAIKKLNLSAEKFANEQEKIFSRQINFETFIKLLNAIGIFYILLNLEVGQIEFAVWIFILLSVFEIFCLIAPAVQTYKKISKIKLEKIAEKSFTDLPTKFAIEFEKINFSYDGKNFVLKDFDLKVGRGEKICVVGESGAGKTTLLYLMTKNFFPDSGKISVNGNIFASTHENFIFGKSIRYNFEIYCGEISEEKIFEILKICQLENFEIDDEIGEDGNFLSGGERVRLQIALAVAKNPEILILDEPTAGLDKKRAEKLIDTVIEDSTKKNRTLIIITHDLDIAKKFDKTLKIN